MYLNSPGDTPTSMGFLFFIMYQIKIFEDVNEITINNWLKVNNDIDIISVIQTETEYHFTITIIYRTTK